MNNHPLPTKTSLAIFAILTLGVLAVSMGYDNGILSAAIAVIAGLGGYATGRATKSKQSCFLSLLPKHSNPAIDCLLAKE